MIKIKMISRATDPANVWYFSASHCTCCDKPLPIDDGFFMIGDCYNDGCNPHIFVCPSCLYQLHLATTPLQILLTTGKNIKP